MVSDVIQTVAINKADGSFQRNEQEYHIPMTSGFTGGTSTVGYVKNGRDYSLLTLAQNATADTWVVALPRLHTGDVISKIGLHGQIDSGGNAVTIDYELRKMTPASTGTVDASVQTGTQIAKSANYKIDDSTVLATPYKIIDSTSLYILITCTTAATTDIELTDIHITIDQR